MKKDVDSISKRLWDYLLLKRPQYAPEGRLNRQSESRTFRDRLCDDLKIGGVAKLSAVFLVFFATGCIYDSNAQSVQYFSKYCNDNAIHTIRAIVDDKDSPGSVKFIELQKNFRADGTVDCREVTLDTIGGLELKNEFLSFPDLERVGDTVRSITEPATTNCGQGRCTRCYSGFLRREHSENGRMVCRKCPENPC